jgi:RNA polymerase sigma factor (sigma-70 family)
VGTKAAEPDGSARDALRAAYEEHYARLVRLCGLLAGSREAAEDIVQEVFVRGASRIPGLPPLEVWPYLRVAVANEWKNRRRRIALDHRVRPRLLFMRSPTQRALGNGDEVWQAVLRLPPKQRACLVLRFYEDLSEKETARVLGVSVGTVKSQTSRALSKMREELER